MKALVAGSRKVIVVLAAVAMVEAIGTVALFLDKLTSEQWCSLNEWVIPWAVGLFVAGNIGEHLGKRGAKAADPS